MDVASVNNNWVDSYLDALVSCSDVLVVCFRCLRSALPRYHHQQLQQVAFGPRDPDFVFLCS
jgi:hypothetical protein